MHVAMGRSYLLEGAKHRPRVPSLSVYLHL